MGDQVMNPKDMSLVEVRGIVDKVLSDHKVKGVTELCISRIATSLYLAAFDGPTAYETGEAYEKDLEEVAALERSISILEGRGNKHGTYRVWVSALERDDPDSYQKTIGYLKTLVQRVQESWEGYQVPETAPHRPLTEKGKSSIDIYRVLQRLNAGNAWRCSNLIAEMFIAFGIDDPPKERVVRALYDRLSRI